MERCHKTATDDCDINLVSFEYWRNIGYGLTNLSQPRPFLCLTFWESTKKLRRLTHIGEIVNEKGKSKKVKFKRH